MKKYCIKGYEGLTGQERDEICQLFEVDAVSGSELDEKILFFLASQGYTEEACLEFWGRAGIALYRPEKEQKNKNYFSMSYAKALAYARSAIEQKDKTKTINAQKDKQIMVEHCMTMITKTTGGYETILTGELVLEAKYYDEDAISQTEREWFDIKVHVRANNETISYSRMIPGEAFAAVSSFKKWGCGEYLRLITNDGSALQCLLRHLEDKYPNVPIRHFHSKIMYKKGKFLFPHYTVTAEGPTLNENNAMFSTLAAKFPVYEWFDGKFFTKDEATAFVRKNWTNLLNFHLPRLVLSMMGTIAITAFKPILEEKLDVSDFNLPTINVRGSSHSGKTETVRKLCKLAGVRDKKNVVSTESTVFAMQRTLEITNFIPLVIDEFKQTEHNTRIIEQVRSMVRRIYSGEMLSRGRSNLDIVTFKLNGSLIIVGEHELERIGDVAEISRVIPINTDEYQPELHVDSYFEVSDVKWEWLAPHFYSSLLRIDPAEAYEEFKQLRKTIVNSLTCSFTGEKIRVGHNLATIWFGVRLWDRFIKSIAPELPSAEETLQPNIHLVEYLKEWAVASEQTLVVKNEVEPDKPKVYANNELLKMIKTVNELFLREDKIIAEAGLKELLIQENKKEDTLLINLGHFYSIYKEYSRKVDEFVPPKTKMFSLAKAAKTRGEEWIKENNRVVKHKERYARMSVFSLKLLVEMNIWGETGFTSSKPGRPAS